MSNRRKRDKKTEKIIAKKRIQKLFLLSQENALEGKLNLADRYVEIARKISMRYQIKIPSEYKHLFCKKCYSFLLPGITCRKRIKKGKIVIFCKKCNNYTRVPIK